MKNSNRNRQREARRNKSRASGPPAVSKYAAKTRPQLADEANKLPMGPTSE